MCMYNGKMIWLNNISSDSGMRISIYEKLLLTLAPYFSKQPLEVYFLTKLYFYQVVTLIMYFGIIYFKKSLIKKKVIIVAKV